MSKGDDFSSDCYRERPKTGKSFRSGDTSSDQARKATSAEQADEKMLGRGRRISSLARHSLWITLDVTGSNRELARIFFDKFMSFWGQIMYPGKTIKEIEKIEKGLAPMDQIPYSNSFDVMLGYITDANHNTYVLQHTDCVRGEQILVSMKGMVNEGGGGGNERESYELDAYRIVHYCDCGPDSTPLYFLICDEVPYEILEASVIRRFLDPDYSGPDISTKQIYEELFAKLKGNVFIIVNPYSGRNSDGTIAHPNITARMFKYWQNLVPEKYKGHVISLLQEKAFVDVLLGIFSRRIEARDKAGYTDDMISKEQDEERIALVNQMLSFLDNKKVSLDDVPDGSSDHFDDETERL